jgi:hypothetical protein
MVPDRLTVAARPARTADVAESMAISASVLCLIHCLALPMLFASSPWLGRNLGLPFDAHLWVVLLAGPVSAWLLLKAASQQRIGVFIAGFAGLCALVLALVLPVSGPMEAVISTLGSLTLAAAHIANWMARHDHRQRGA